MSDCNELNLDETKLKKEIKDFISNINGTNIDTSKPEHKELLLKEIDIMIDLNKPCEVYLLDDVQDITNLHCVDASAVRV